MKKEEILVVIGSLIKKRRKELGLTQEQLASNLGLKQSQIYYYEKGIYNIRIDLLFRFAEELEVSPIYFIEGVLNKNNLMV